MLSPLMLCDDTWATATSGFRNRSFRIWYVFWLVLSGPACKRANFFRTVSRPFCHSPNTSM